MFYEGVWNTIEENFDKQRQTGLLIKTDYKESKPILVYFSAPSVNFREKIYFTEFCSKPICPVSWDCRIHQLHLCRGVKPSQHVYDTKQSDGEVPVMLGLWRMWSTPS